MLKQRIFTALILIPLFVTLVLSLSAEHFAVLTGLIVFWCAWEWSGLLGIKSVSKKLVYPIVVISIVLTIVYLLFMRIISVMPLLYIAFGWWLIACGLVVLYPRYSEIWGKGIWIRGIMGLVVLIPCWVALNFIRATPYGPYMILSLFILVWGADSGAYFVGKLWGKNKLIPEVSPGKTWQGLIGAILTSILIVVIAMMVLNFKSDLLITWLLLAFIIVLFSVLGDLFESMLKRKAGIKDSGTLLPGHGGILDRIDSLTAAAPMFALGMLWMGQS